MIRLLVFLVALLALALGFAWLADNPGEVTFVWLGQRVETDTTTAFVALGALIVAVIAVLAIVRALLRMPGSIFGFFGRRRREKGWAALSRGLIAIGAGDLSTATKAAGEARWILGDEPLALVLEAQSAQLIGDRGGAERAFQTMLETPETKLLGLRGLYVEAVRWGDGAAAAHYAEAANKAAPKLAWAGTALVDHRSQTRDWQGALETIDRNRRNGVIDKAAARRARAVVLTADGLERETSAAEIVRGTALEAHGLAPDLVPAACLAARLSAAHGDLRKAAKIIETTWKIEPHPELAEAYARLRSGDAAQDRLARIRELVKIKANHPEGVLALARAAIEAKDFATARAALTPLLTATPTRRICLAMAALEDGEHGDAGATRAWLTRAVHAPRDRAWVADGFVAEHWAPLSPVTGRLDAFEWKLPPEDAVGPITDALDEAAEALAASGSVLPLEGGHAARPSTERAPAPRPAAEVVIEDVATKPAQAMPEATSAAPAPSTAAPSTSTKAAEAEPPRPAPEPAKTEPTAIRVPADAVAPVPPSDTLPPAPNGAAAPLPLPDDPGVEGEAEPKVRRFRLFS